MLLADLFPVLGVLVLPTTVRSILDPHERRKRAVAASGAAVQAHPGVARRHLHRRPSMGRPGQRSADHRAPRPTNRTRTAPHGDLPQRGCRNESVSSGAARKPVPSGPGAASTRARATRTRMPRVWRANCWTTRASTEVVRPHRSLASRAAARCSFMNWSRTRGGDGLTDLSSSVDALSRGRAAATAGTRSRGDGPPSRDHGGLRQPLLEVDAYAAAGLTRRDPGIRACSKRASGADAGIRRRDRGRDLPRSHPGDTPGHARCERPATMPSSPRVDAAGRWEGPAGYARRALPRCR